MKLMKAVFALVAIAVAGSAFASPQAVSLISYNQRSGSGTLSTLAWRAGCVAHPGNGCFDYGNSWVASNIDGTGSTASWTFDSSTGILSSSGLFIAASFLSSNSSGYSILADRVVGLSIDTVGNTIGGSVYNCIEGTFLPLVGATGCANTLTGGNSVDESSVAYNVGSNPFCEVRTIGGDDSSGGNPRGLATAAAGGGCDATDGAFNMFTVVSNSGGFLVISNGIPLTDPNTSYLTFAVPVPAAVWLFGSALGLLGWVRRRTLSA